jgi:hypothetical protein
MKTLLAVILLAAAAAGWNPEAFRSEDTLEFLTVGPQEGEHWSRVWLVVVDGVVYVRLASRAAGRMRDNTTAPYVKVRVGGHEFERVKAEPAPEMAEKVGAAMREKYWGDVFVRYFGHPLVVKLRPEA